MSDWPGERVALFDADRAVLSTLGLESMFGDYATINRINEGAATWPTNNLAIYVPVVVPMPCTVYQMAINVTTQSGNVDVGIYSEQGTQLVAAGSTATAVAGIQVFNIADTALKPGLYYLAMSCSTTVAAFTRCTSTAAQNARVMGCQSQVTALPLPATATFATASSYVPMLVATLDATTI